MSRGFTNWGLSHEKSFPNLVKLCKFRNVSSYCSSEHLAAVNLCSFHLLWSSSFKGYTKLTTATQRLQTQCLGGAAAFIWVSVSHFSGGRYQEKKANTSLSFSHESEADGLCLESPCGSTWLLITTIYRTDREKPPKESCSPLQFPGIHFI